MKAKEPTRKRILTLLTALLGWLAFADHAAAGESIYYISPDGDDAWSGRLADANAGRTDGPWKTLAKACAAVQPGDICRLRRGVYREVLKPQRDGTAESPIVFESQAGEAVLLSGADAVGG
ncbi:MAG: hypothetical protein MUE50_23745, partial [Pirellulaceae bacterium]|nr:hypothetical protein [Pirellulaceae bacterium]